jgi:hypothetical protein
MRRTLALISLSIGLASTLAIAQSNRVAVTFAPQTNDPKFETAADEYRQLWAAEGARIIDALERVSNLKFPEKDIKAEIYEGPSFSGRGNIPIRLRASYPADVKKGTLVHELGHRMNAQLTRRPQDLDEHRLLFLYLYEAWDTLYGKEFADREVAFERTLKGLYDYDAAWTWALAMSEEQRIERFAGVRKANRR